MKRINEMTNSEIVKLTPEEIIDCIDIECGLQGISLLPVHPGSKPISPVANKDTDVFSIGDIHSTSKDIVNQISSILSNADSLVYIYGYGDKQRVVPINNKDYRHPAISEEKYISEEAYDKVSSLVAVYEKDVGLWTESREHYDNIVSSRNEVDNQVTRTVCIAKERINLEEQLRVYFIRYLELTEGDPMLAMNILIDTQKAIDGGFKDLVEELCPGYVLADKLKKSV